MPPHVGSRRSARVIDTYEVKPDEEVCGLLSQFSGDELNNSTAYDGTTSRLHGAHVQM